MSEKPGPPEDEAAEYVAPVHGAENFDVSAGAAAIPEEERVKVSKEDLRPPEEFSEGEALINLVVNLKDIRDPKDVKEDEGTEIGSLYPEQVREFRGRMEDYMDKVYAVVPADERQDVDVIILAGETDLVTPGPEGLRNEHQRAMETGDVAIDGIRASMEKYGLDPETALTTQHDRPIAVTNLDDIRLLHPLDSDGDKAYLEFMVEKYGTGRELWIAFEVDKDKEVREQLGAEGPEEIADRTAYFVDICSTIADLHQANNPGKRVVVFGIGHYDNLSPWVKKHLMHADDIGEAFVPMEKGSGVVIQRAADGTASTKIGNRKFDVDLASVV